MHESERERERWSQSTLELGKQMLSVNNIREWEDKFLLSLSLTHTFSLFSRNLTSSLIVNTQPNHTVTSKERKGRYFISLKKVWTYFGIKRTCRSLITSPLRYLPLKKEISKSHNVEVYHSKIGANTLLKEWRECFHVPLISRPQQRSLIS